MARHNTHSGLAENIGSASTYSNQYYYGTDTGLYYYSDGASWVIKTFDDSRSVVNRPGTITAGGTAQLVMAANTDRRWLFLQNTSNTDMYLGLGYIPTSTTGVWLAKDGGSIRFDTFVPTDAVHILCTSASKTFVALEG